MLAAIMEERTEMLARRRFWDLRNPAFWRFWQTVCIALFLFVLLCPYPKNLISYIMGFALGFSLVHALVLPRQERRRFSLWRNMVPYLVFYAVVFLSCFFSDDFSRAFSYCGKYFSLVLIPLVFLGMTASFFTPRRLRIFAFAFVAGMVLAALWKLGVLLHCYLFHPDLVRYKELGFREGLVEFLRFFRVYVTGYELPHPTFEALFMNAAFARVALSWLGGDSFFSSVRGRSCGAGCLLLFFLVLVVFSSKMAFFLWALSCFFILVYAVRRKKYMLAGGTIGILVVLFAAFLPLIRSTIVPRFAPMVQNLAAFPEDGEEEMEDDGSFLPRLYCYRLGWDMFRERPWLGYGPAYGDMFRHRFDEAYSSKLDVIHFGYRHPHNQFLGVLVSTGLLGFSVFLWLFLTVFRDVCRSRDVFWRLWFIGLLLLFMVDMIFSFTVGFVYLCGFHGILAARLENRRSGSPLFAD